MGNTLINRVLNAEKPVECLFRSWYAVGITDPTGDDTAARQRRQQWWDTLGFSAALEEGVYLVSLRHHQTGPWQVFVDGQLVCEGKDGSTDESFSLPTFCVGGCPAKLTVIFDRAMLDPYWGYIYNLSIDGQQVPSSQDYVPAGYDSPPLTTTISEAILVDVVPSDPLSTRLHQTTQASGARRCVAFYVVRTLERGKEAVHVQRRRFREFVALRSVVRSVLLGTSAFSAVPPLPDKKLRLLHDHMNREAVEARRKALEEWLWALLRLPLMTTTPEVRCFLGLTPFLSLASSR